MFPALLEMEPWTGETEELNRWVQHWSTEFQRAAGQEYLLSEIADAEIRISSPLSYIQQPIQPPEQPRDDSAGREQPPSPSPMNTNEIPSQESLPYLC